MEEAFAHSARDIYNVQTRKSEKYGNGMTQMASDTDTLLCMQWR